MALNLDAAKKAQYKKKWAFESKVTSAYSAPLAKMVDGVDVESALTALGKEILRKVRQKLKQSAFSDAAKKRLAKALAVKSYPNSIRIVAKDPLWNYLVNGQKKGQMKWLKRARAPIPIVTETGQVIFRSATAKSMADGKWIHPGRPIFDVMDLAKKEARAVVQKKLLKNIVGQIQNKLK
jgi:hypothetical protein